MKSVKFSRLQRTEKHGSTGSEVSFSLKGTALVITFKHFRATVPRMATDQDFTTADRVPEKPR